MSIDHPPDRKWRRLARRGWQVLLTPVRKLWELSTGTRSYVLAVSREGVVKSLRDQFTRSTTFLAEALQNARRAGASAVEILWDEDSRVLTITDDGSGIANFEALFTVGKSGWDAEIVERDHPFGIGFMSAVWASEHMEIHSHDRCTAFNTDEFIRYARVAVRRAPRRKGTQLKLTVCATHIEAVRQGYACFVPKEAGPPITFGWRSALAALVKGFPIPVFFNGEELPRPHRLEGELYFQKTDFGHWYLDGWKSCTPPDSRRYPVLYCQGLPIQATRTHLGLDETQDVLHLDHHRFRVRTPDRDVLIDARQQEERIYQQRQALWRERFTTERATLDAQTFVDRHWQHCVAFGIPELLRDAPLSASMLQLYLEPASLCELKEQFSDWTDRVPPRDGLFIRDLCHRYSGDSDDPPAPLASVYALKRQLPVIKPNVPACHWVYDAVVDVLDDELILDYELHGAGEPVEFNGEWVRCQVQVCECYTIRWSANHGTTPAALERLTPLDVSDVAFYDIARQRIVVPAKAGWAGDVVKQISDFMDGDDHYREDERDTDERTIGDLVCALRSPNAAAYLTLLLKRLHPDPKFLGQSAFRVRYDAESRALIAQAA